MMDKLMKGKDQILGEGADREVRRILGLIILGHLRAWLH